MRSRLALLIIVEAGPDKRAGTMRLHNPDTGRDTDIPPLTLLLTLAHEPDATYCRGQLTVLPENTAYPIQSNERLFAALSAVVERDQIAE